MQVDPLSALARWLLVVSCLSQVVLAQAHEEKAGDPPAVPLRQGGFTPSLSTVTRGPFVSIQVNIDRFGNNIRGDAANEPSIAIDPTDPRKIV
ncbi:MAG: hypothetical protein ACE5F1_20025, partial [Planctomycetota bacterium]